MPQVRALKKYIQFLLSQPAHIAEIQQLYYQEILQSDIPLPKQFKEAGDRELRVLTDRGLSDFLEQLLQDKVREGALQSITRWMKEGLPGLPGEKVKYKDIVKIFNIRKLVCLRLFQRYSTDFNEYDIVHRQLERMHDKWVEHTFQAYLKNHEEKVQQEKELTSSIINNSVTAIMAFDKEARISEWNNVCERWYSLKKSDVMGKEIFEVFPEYEHTEEGEAIGRVFKGEHVFLSERPLLATGGYCQANIFPLYNNRKKIAGGISIVQETTRRRETREKLQLAYDQLQAQQEELIAKNKALRDKQKDLDLKDTALNQTITALQESRQNAVNARDYYLQILEDFPALIWRSGTDGKCNYFNNGWLKFTGLSLAEQVGDGWQKAVHPDDLEEFKQVYRSAFQKRESFVMDYRLKNSKGEYRYIVDYVKPVFGLENEFLGYIGACFDIQDRIDAENTAWEKNNELTTAFNALAFTERKLKQANKELEDRVKERTRELSSREAQLRLVTDAVPVLISYLDRDKRYRFVNKEYEKWFSLKKEDIIGKRALHIIGKEAHDNILPYVNSAFRGEQVFVDTRQDYKSIGPRYVNANFIPDIVDGKVEGIYILIYDITSRKKNEKIMEQLYDEAKKRNQELKRINTDLDNFIYTASHDLKSPVVNLEGLLSQLQKTQGAHAEEDEFLLKKMMRQSIEKLKKTILDLVEITKVQKDIARQAKVKVSFMEVTQDVRAGLQPLIQESQATISEEFGVETIFYVRSNLRSIIYNLLSNALKYRSPERQAVIRISTAQAPDGQVKLSVEDNGLGMTEGQQKKLFTMFRRLHTHVEGTGIGLYTIKRIIENNGGSIKVSSRVNQATRFEVFFQ